MRKYFVLKVLIGLAAFAILSTPNSRTADGKVGYERIVDAFFQKIQGGKAEEAITYYFSQNPLMAGMSVEVERLKGQIGAAVKTLGEYRGRQLLVKRVIAGRLIVVRYFAFYDAAPARFTFHFYKPKEAWVPLYVFFDTNYAKELAAATSLETILRVQ